MDIYFQSQIGTCSEYIGEEKGGKKESVSVIISPLRVQTDQDAMNMKVVNGCNMWQGCRNKKCHLSKAARLLPKVGSKS